MAAEERDEALVDRARRLDRQLLADDRPYERGVVVTVGPAVGVRLSVQVEQPPQDRVGRPQDIERPGYGCPATTPGTPVLVEYFGWILVSGRMRCTACDTAIAASA